MGVSVYRRALSCNLPPAHVGRNEVDAVHHFFCELTARGGCPLVVGEAHDEGGLRALVRLLRDAEGALKISDVPTGGSKRDEEGDDRRARGDEEEVICLHD